MNTNNFLRDNHKAIAAQWVESILQTYAEEGSKFFSANANQFANPVGHAFRANVDSILSVLSRGEDVGECAKALDGILRIRAVQGFSPSVALCFLPALKEIVYREFRKASPDTPTDDALHEWNVTVDRLTMLGFDLYMNCRELLWKQKANHLYNRTHKLLEKANVLESEEVAG